MLGFGLIGSAETAAAHANRLTEGRLLHLDILVCPITDTRGWDLEGLEGGWVSEGLGVAYRGDTRWGWGVRGGGIVWAK